MNVFCPKEGGHQNGIGVINVATIFTLHRMNNIWEPKLCKEVFIIRQHFEEKKSGEMNSKSPNGRIGEYFLLETSLNLTKQHKIDVIWVIL